jgi:hypothetical protein
MARYPVKASIIILDKHLPPEEAYAFPIHQCNMSRLRPHHAARPNADPL